MKGESVKAGEHLDLVGSFKHCMRECNYEAIRRGRVFVDNKLRWSKHGNWWVLLREG